MGCVSVIEDYDDFYECKFRMVPQAAAKREERDAAAAATQQGTTTKPCSDAAVPEVVSEPAPAPKAVAEAAAAEQAVPV